MDNLKIELQNAEKQAKVKILLFIDPFGGSGAYGLSLGQLCGG